MTPHAHAAGSRESALRTGVITGFIDTMITLTAMLVANSAVLLADFLKTFLELIAVALSWYAMRRITRGRTEQFDYGMGKMENLVSLAVGTLMAVCLLVISANAIRNILHPVHIEGVGVWISMGAQITYACINSYIAVQSRKTAREENSPLMASQARLHFTRAIANGFILFSLTASMVLSGHHWAQYIDPIASLVIAASILMAALGIFSTSVSDLLDRTLEESDQLLILRELTRHFNEYEFLHGVRSRRSGSRVFIDIFLEFDPEKKMRDIQKTADHLRRSIEEKIQGSLVTIGLATGPVSNPTER